MGMLGGSERHRFVLGAVFFRLVEQVVARTQTRDEACLLGHCAFGRQQPNGHGAASAVIGQSGIVAQTAGVLATPELLVTAPGLEMSSKGLIQAASMSFTDIDDGISAVALALADEVHTRLAAQRADPVRI